MNRLDTVIAIAVGLAALVIICCLVRDAIPRRAVRIVPPANSQLAEVVYVSTTSRTKVRLSPRTEGPLLSSIARAIKTAPRLYPSPPAMTPSAYLKFRLKDGSQQTLLLGFDHSDEAVALLDEGIRGSKELWPIVEDLERRAARLPGAYHEEPLNTPAGK